MLTLQFVPYNKIANLTSEERINTLLKTVKEEKIILLEGRLEEREKAELITKTMQEINEKFSGIELEDMNTGNTEQTLYKKIRRYFIKMLLGNREGVTIIGPANIIKEIKKDPDKIQLYMKSSEGSSKRKSKK